MAFVHSFTYTPPKRYDANAWAQVKIEESADDETFADVETLTLTPADSDPSAPAERELTTEVATLETGYFRLTPIDASGDEGPTSDSVFSPAGATALATQDDVEARLGRDLTEAEATTVAFLLEGATALIYSALGQDDDWDLDPVPAIVRFVTVEAVFRVLTNPEALGTFQESLGAYDHSKGWRGSDPGGFKLTDIEVMLVRKAAYGRLSDSVQIGSVFVDNA